MRPSPPLSTNLGGLCILPFPLACLRPPLPSRCCTPLLNCLHSLASPHSFSLLCANLHLRSLPPPLFRVR